MEKVLEDFATSFGLSQSVVAYPSTDKQRVRVANNVFTIEVDRRPSLSMYSNPEQGLRKRHRLFRMNSSLIFGRHKTSKETKWKKIGCLSVCLSLHLALLLFSISSLLPSLLWWAVWQASVLRCCFNFPGRIYSMITHTYRSNSWANKMTGCE